MFKAVAIAALALGAVSVPDVMAEEQDAGARAAQPHEPSGTSEDDAKQRAREALAQRLKIAQDDVAVTHVEPHTWSDSSMGCGEPGTAALTVITEGYAVKLSAQGREHEVHVSGRSAVICDAPGLVRRHPQSAVRGRGLDIMMERARQDLAKRLGVEASDIRLAGLEPHRWPDSTLDCPQPGETAQPGPVQGYRLSLQHASRIYTYHTDRESVRPCPAIEPQ